MYDYNELDKFLTEGRKQDVKKIHHNTWVKRSNGDIVIQFHDTDIMIFNPDNNVILNTDGWLTFTTKERFNRFLNNPFSIYQERKIWYLYNWNSKEAYPFQDGITINLDTNEVSNYAKQSDIKEKKALMKKVKKYVEEYISLFLEDKLDKPSGGDCWNCYMTFPKDGDHILSHIEEDYYVPSLLLKAIEEYRVSPIVNSVVYEKWYSDNPEDVTFLNNIAKEQLSKSLEKYMLSCLDLVR